MAEQQAIPLNVDSSPDAVIELLFKLKVKDVMSTSIYSASPNDTLRQIQQIMKSMHITGLPVVDGTSLLGIVSMNDIVNAFDRGWIDEPVKNHMTEKVIVLQENMPVSFCVSYFNKYKFGRFPVLNNENKLTGIVTATDVISALLIAMNKEVERLEREALLCVKPTVASQEHAGKIIEFNTEPFNFEIAGKASTELKKLLKSMNIEPALTRRMGIASYELEINQVVHSIGGMMRYFIYKDKIVIEASDRGPGIPDLKKALTEGFSTATDKIRALGFGAGMGLPNTKRVSDEFDITSSAEKGTRVLATFHIPEIKIEEENKETK